MDDHQGRRQRLGSGWCEVLDSDLPPLRPAVVAGGGGGDGHRADEEENGQSEQEALHCPSFRSSARATTRRLVALASVSSPFGGLSTAGGTSSPSPKNRRGRPFGL